MLYAVLIEDRHVEVVVELFRTQEGAVQRCKDIYEEKLDRDRDENGVFLWPDILKQLDAMNARGGGVYWYFSTEGDCAHWMPVDDPK